MEELSQTELLELLARKDNRAYRWLYQRYYTALRSLANDYVKNWEEAEDLVQDVFISLLESGRRFETVNDLKYFLYASMKNKCISYLRKEKVRDAYREEVLASKTEEEHYWDRAMEEDVYARLMTAIDTLPPQCRVVMQLTLEGLTGNEIAQRLHISPDTVKEHKSNGKQKLAVLLKGGEWACLVSLFLS